MIALDIAKDRAHHDRLNDQGHRQVTQLKDDRTHREEGQQHQGHRRNDRKADGHLRDDRHRDERTDGHTRKNRGKGDGLNLEDMQDDGHHLRLRHRDGN